MKKGYFNQYKYLFEDETKIMKNKNQFDRFARIFRNVLDEDFQYAFEMGCIKADVGSYSGLFTKAKKDDISPGMTVKYIVDYITDKNAKSESYS